MKNKRYDAFEQEEQAIEARRRAMIEVCEARGHDWHIDSEDQVNFCKKCNKVHVYYNNPNIKKSNTFKTLLNIVLFTIVVSCFFSYLNYFLRDYMGFNWYIVGAIVTIVGLVQNLGLYYAGKYVGNNRNK